MRPRLRTPVKFAAMGAVTALAAAVAYGWSALLYFVPVVLAISAGYYIWAGGDSDMAALLRNQADERQEYRRLKIQALVGRVTSGASAIAYLAAFLAKTTMWPFAIFLAVPVAALFAGWMIYREPGMPANG